ncbi:Hypothetical protein SMAX5B_015540 [Scophthalmus maximus]|uniref:Uncharacterized protein n=1 Tax=Scophthalmus maximus TaxID=52904 RepID=A0A2U9CXV3_SCOMX|nr:Hypothetical protein SMAX5B_015540 [Scophthalmus maximus]
MRGRPQAPPLRDANPPMKRVLRRDDDDDSAADALATGCAGSGGDFDAQVRESAGCPGVTRAPELSIG